MFRLLITIGGVLLELISMATDGAMTVSVLLTGAIVSGVHFASDSSTFKSIVDRLTGCDLPERLDLPAEELPKI